MRTLVATKNVPGTDVVIVLDHQPADPRLAAILKDRPGSGLWVDRWYVTRHPGTSNFVNYLHTARTDEAEARAEANFLWTDTVTRRDAR